MAEDRREKLSEVLNGLVRKFEANKGAYKASSFLEANLRLEFIDVLFEGLGWDVHNKKGLPPSRKEVIVERGESGDRPDYNFRIDGVPVLYVETKKPAEDLDKTAHIMQAKTYAWSGKRVKVVGLTDFEEFRLFDATLKPNPRFAEQGEIFRLRYDEYLGNLDKLLLLNPHAIAEGSLDGLLLKDKKSVAQRKPVDKEFLNDLNAWRLMLGKGLFKKSGYTYKDHEISDLVQHLLDRILFIRIAGERDVIEPRQLADKLKYWKDSKHKYGLYKDILVPLFREMNRDVDGDLLKPSHVDDAPFDDADVAELIEDLYPPKSIYRFDEMPIELIGAAYEQYLGNVIRCTPKQVKLEPKPEVRKAGGVYYTPEYIVDYIVENTVGKLVEGKTPQEVEALKILDPACGSGSFLIGALEYLIDYVATYYREHADEAGRDQIFPYLVEDYERGEERLSLERKVRLLENCFYGVDIDPHAVEVTKLSLYLKVLEGERRLPRKHALLKSLDKNIKCGNSLIGSDYWDFVRDKQGEFFERTEEEERRVNPFDWEVGFKEIINAGGFNAVIGNPPWIQSKYLEKADKTYYESNYVSAAGQYDVFNTFIERGKKVLRENGVFGFIVPTRILMNPDYVKLREFLSSNVLIKEIVDVGEHIFEGVEMPAMLLFYQKTSNTKQILDNQVSVKTDVGNLVIGDFRSYYFPQKRFLEDEEFLFTIYQEETLRAIIKKVEGVSVKFGDIVKNARGVEIGKKSPLVSEKPIRGSVPFLTGEDMGRYYIKGNHYLELGAKGINYKEDALYKGEKIIIRKTGTGINATVDNEGYYVIQVIYIFKKANDDYDNKYLLGLLNSKLLGRVYFAKFGEEKKQAFPHLRQTNVLSLAIRKIRFSDPTDIARHDKMVALVEEMLELHKRLNAARADADKQRLQRAISATDRKIDALVYELYGLTPDEIKIVEGS